MICKICGNERCIGKYLLHPKEMIFVQRIKETHLKINPKRNFRIVDSPPSGELFIKFKELHVIAAPDEDLDTARNEEIKVFIKDLLEQITGGDK